jgi:hypothetical protein
MGRYLVIFEWMQVDREVNQGVAACGRFTNVTSISMGIDGCRQPARSLVHRSMLEIAQWDENITGNLESGW